MNTRLFKESILNTIKSPRVRIFMAHCSTCLGSMSRENPRLLDARSEHWAGCCLKKDAGILILVGQLGAGGHHHEGHRAPEALVEVKLKMSDIASMVELCSAIHQRYAEFTGDDSCLMCCFCTNTIHQYSGCLVENWTKMLTLKKDEKVSNPSKMRVDLRYIDLRPSTILHTCFAVLCFDKSTESSCNFPLQIVFPGYIASWWWWAWSPSRLDCPWWAMCWPHWWPRTRTRTTSPTQPSSSGFSWTRKILSLNSLQFSFCKHCGDDFAGLTPASFTKLMKRYYHSENISSRNFSFLI